MSSCKSLIFIMVVLGSLLSACTTHTLTADFSRDESDPVRETRLMRAERQLEGRREREQYFLNRPYMRSAKDRLEFLSLGTYQEREAWLDAHGIRNGVVQHSAAAQSLIDDGDIAIGMTLQAVRSSWGIPEQIDVAGNPIYGNQRWYYSDQVSSTEGYLTQRRVVTFREGRVVGWESH